MITEREPAQNLNMKILYLLPTSNNSDNQVNITLELHTVATHRVIRKGLSSNASQSEERACPMRTRERESSDANVQTVFANTLEISNQKNQISLSSLNTLSGVTSERCPSPRLCAKAHTIKHQKRTSYHLRYLAGYT